MNTYIHSYDNPDNPDSPDSPDNPGNPDNPYDNRDGQVPPARLKSLLMHLAIPLANSPRVHLFLLWTRAILKHHGVFLKQHSNKVNYSNLYFNLSSNYC